ncbi:hypothetical protein GS597_01210 [Synechococcales cyanobacterium C]|uniref:Peptidase A2 domain-containing protein n=1 Tax=Petrachloros mirabilis ULC683 TaxID=2781853 RepID=A0A8K1ZW11_9CYAN|nr:retroviral-like aspartic protease family protein [Petrachloros mirabilis]NCJ05158.1 hypothetical protein [Petrachloros mirabilis ULC683]
MPAVQHIKAMQLIWHCWITPILFLSAVISFGGTYASLAVADITPPAVSPPRETLRVRRPIPLEANLQAIVHLQDFAVDPPQTFGSGRLPLVPFGDTGVHVLRGTFGNQPQWFLLDTGASTSLLSDAITQTLPGSGQVISPQQLGFAVAGEDCPDMSATLHQVPDLQLETVRITNLWGLQFQHVQIPQGISAVLGMDVLRQFDVHIQPGQKSLRLLPPTILPANVVAEAIPLKERLGVMLTKVQLNGQGPFTMLLDTGAGSTFISEGVAQQLRLQSDTLEPIHIQGFCGLETAMRSRLTSLKLQQHEQTNLETIILSSPILEMLNVDGILGQNFLNGYRQYWRFTPANLPTGKVEGSLLLYPESP